MNLVVILIGCIVASVYDLRERRIPNWLVLFLFVIGVALALLNHRLFEFVFYVFIAIVVLLPLFAFRQIGAGDVKLIAVIAGYFGLEIINIAFYFSIVGAGIAFCLIFLRKRLPWIECSNLPYAVPITIGLIVYTVYGGII